MRYSDFGNKYLGYHKNYYDYFSGDWNSNIDISYSDCQNREEDDFYEPKINDCDNLFLDIASFSNPFKNIYEQWVATIILGCFNLIFNIGLAIFGFFLFRETNGEIGRPSPVIIIETIKKYEWINIY